MGQTLTHGIYLPDEGERNCYNGLAANWQLLDGAVGTVAEHTSQIAGKANAVHTHTKADITNLLNSNFIPSANNSYDLGSSSYQWNNLYAKNYYYNGTAWGLDKANVWSGDNSFTSARITLKNSNITRGTIPSINRNYVLSFTDSNNDNVGMIFQQVRTGSGSYKMTFSLNNGTTDHRFNFLGFTNGTSSLMPEVSGVTELGSSDNKWKSLNGVNPGALSLPNYDASIAQDISGDMVPDQYGRNIRFTPTMNGWMYVDFNISNATLLSGSQGMLVQVKDSSIANANFVVNFIASIGSSHIFVYLPVLKGKSIILEINFTGFSIGKGYIYPCQGNVS